MIIEDSNLNDLLEKAEAVAFHMKEYEESCKQYALRAERYIECKYGYSLFALFHAAKTGLFDKVSAVRRDHSIEFNPPQLIFFHISYGYDCRRNRYNIVYKNQNLLDMKPWEIDRNFKDIMRCIEETIQYIAKAFEEQLKH